jgi:hypothetical protein
MNRKQFVIVLLALAVIGGAGLLLFQKKQKTWNVREAKVGEYVVPNFKPNDVAAIHVIAAGDFRIVRSNGVWIVPDHDNYRANFNQISEVLLEVKQLKVAQSDIVGPSMLERVDLKKPGTGPHSAELVEFEDEHGKVLCSMWLGRRHDRKQNPDEPLGMRGWFDGRYILLPSEPENVLLIPSELPGAAPSAAGWLDPEFFKIENAKFIGMVSPDPEKNWELIRETPQSKWALNGSSDPLDREAMAQTTEIWQFPRFTDCALNVPTSVSGLDKPTVITVITFDNIAYTVKVGKKTEQGKYFMTVSVAGAMPPERTPNPGETPEEKKRLDDEYQAHKKSIEEKLVKERAYSNWTFLADDWLNVVVRDRSVLVHGNSPTREANAK